jgi:hypothetical protein
MSKNEALAIASRLVARAPVASATTSELLPIARGLQAVKADLARMRAEVDDRETAPVGPRPVHSSSQDEELCEAYERLAKEAPESVRESYAKKVRELRAKLGAAKAKDAPATDTLSPKQQAVLARLFKPSSGVRDVVAYGIRAGA